MWDFNSGKLIFLSNFHDNPKLSLDNTESLKALQNIIVYNLIISFSNPQKVPVMEPTQT